LDKILSHSPDGIGENSIWAIGWMQDKKSKKEFNSSLIFSIIILRISVGVVDKVGAGNSDWRKKERQVTMLRVATAARVARWTWARQSSALVGDARVARAALTTASAEKITPMVQQYLARKKEYPGAFRQALALDISLAWLTSRLWYVRVGMLADCMLLFQVGDFYEFFGEDARRASAVGPQFYSHWHGWDHARLSLWMFVDLRC
jgi:hypothetical protein